MAYVSVGGRLVNVKKASVKHVNNQVKRKTGFASAAALSDAAKTSVGLAINVVSIAAAVADPNYQHRNPNHNRARRTDEMESPRRQRRTDKAIKRAYNESLIRGSQADVPFDSIELTPEACPYGRCEV